MVLASRPIPWPSWNPVSKEGYIRDQGLCRGRLGIWKQNLGGITYVWMADPPPAFNVIGVANSTELVISEIACVYCFCKRDCLSLCDHRG